MSRQLATFNSGMQHFTTVCITTLVVSVIVLYVTFHVPQYGPNWWDNCAVDRFDKSLVKNNVSNHLIMYLTEILVYIVAIQVSFWKYVVPTKKARLLSSFITYSAAFDFFYMVLWFTSTYMLVVFLKDFMGDTTCNDKPNRFVNINVNYIIYSQYLCSVSGHTCYFVFHIFTLYYFGMYRAPDDRSWRRHLWNACYVVVFVLALVNLNNTYYGGYHSARQMLYGGFVGLLSHLLCVFPMLKHSSRSTHEQSKKSIN